MVIWRLINEEMWIGLESSQWHLDIGDMEENAEELINEAVEAAGVNPDIDDDIENELQNLANNPVMQNLHVHIPVHDQAEQNDQNPIPSGDSVIIIERDEHNTLHEFAHSIR